MRVKSNHYLFRTNGWAFYTIILLLCLVNWDTHITSYNMYSAKNKSKAYLFELGYTNLPELVSIQHMFHYYTVDSSFTQNDTYWNEETEAGYNRALSLKLYYFLQQHQLIGWRSWYVEDTRVYNDLVRLNENKQLHALDLSRMRLRTLGPVNEFNHLSVLILRENHVSNLEVLTDFTSLEKLDLSKNHLSNLKHIELFKKLQYLSLSGNIIYDYSPLYALKNNLKELRVDRSIRQRQLELLIGNMPNTWIVRE